MCPFPTSGGGIGEPRPLSPWGEPDTEEDQLGLELDPPGKTPLEVAMSLGCRVQRADPAVGGCGARAPQPCLGLLGPQEPSPRRGMGSGVSAQVGSVHQGERDREKPPGLTAGLGGWSLLGAKVPPSEFLEHSPPIPS